MCQSCGREEVESGISEHDIQYWKENGKYFGYPQCCIDSFCSRNIDDEFAYEIASYIV